jgi:very-short-patch-repair endonuclease
VSQSQLEAQLALMVRCVGLPEPVQQYRLPELPDRHYRFDFAWVKERLLVEVNGSTWVSNTGHTSGRGIERDTEKANLAVLAGYRLLTVTGTQVKDGRAIGWIEQALCQGKIPQS